MILSLLLAAALAGPPAPKDYPTRIEEAEKTMDGIAGDFFWIGVSGAADLYATAWALDRCPGCRESNGLMFSPEARISLKAAGTLAATGVCYKLRRGRHHRAASIFRWSVTVAQFAFAANNVYRGTRGK